VKLGTECLRVIHLYDPPHLLKGIRNNMLNKNVVFTINGRQKEASWDHIVALYNIESNIEDVRMLPRLTSEHVERKKIKKIKVKKAVQVLSERVSSIMSYLSSVSFILDKINNLHYKCINYYYLIAGVKILNEKAADTAKLCLFFHRLFDSLNGNFDKVIDGKIYRTAVKKNSPHKIWKESLKILNLIYFNDPLTKKAYTPATSNTKKLVKDH